MYKTSTWRIKATVCFSFLTDAHLGNTKHETQVIHVVPCERLSACCAFPTVWEGEGFTSWLSYTSHAHTTSLLLYAQHTLSPNFTAIYTKIQLGYYCYAVNVLVSIQTFGVRKVFQCFVMFNLISSQRLHLLDKKRQ